MPELISRLNTDCCQCWIISSTHLFLCNENVVRFSIEPHNAVRVRDEDLLEW